MRGVVVPADIRPDRLRLAIQAAMGWTKMPLYEFRIGGAGWGEPDPDGIHDGPNDAKMAHLAAAPARPTPAARRSVASMASATPG
ncbi:pRiA4b ORF-3-like protein [Roseiarcus fermentans]|uniref:PRiA4b ORF-3-like protein n=1 Tax=Roseiarcus fermentans TaxID=1473586 RepID=A0A366EY77_9HYPH|nr:pRiA4b ORF-3-like protein [Roseiarcus fermentans]